MKVDENLDEDNTNKKIERQWTRPIKNPINKISDNYTSRNYSLLT